jgi:hypothetical protein
MKITEEVNVETMVYRSKIDGVLVLEIDTSLEEDESIRINLNDGPIYDGAPALQGSALAAVRLIATEILPKLWGSRVDAEQREILNSLDDVLGDYEPEGGWQA